VENTTLGVGCSISSSAMPDLAMDWR